MAGGNTSLGWPFESNTHHSLAQAQSLLLLLPQTDLSKLFLILLLPGPVTAMKKNSKSRSFLNPGYFCTHFL